ncbi:hypothetical protein [Pseudarthrobacter sp. NamB4]|uniref:hypothetical protein n=1 Tax=Pseudarthrobacter sp. NamB4 TaxID=2576837 RepID=UPI0010FE357B|nr:hypothetical protein [Pseudarthrobacter sp. NamB4]TLM75966.1 hypothetical protein FDW81_01030 [Pseudarthrobacter sp. NamB4]
MATDPYGRVFLATPDHHARNQRVAATVEAVPAFQKRPDGGIEHGAAIFSRRGLMAVLTDEQAVALADALHDAVEWRQA